MPKKKFIDKKTALHFSVVRRSQRDPLIAADDKSPFVLVPIYKPGSHATPADYERFSGPPQAPLGDDEDDEDYDEDEEEDDLDEEDFDEKAGDEDEGDDEEGESASASKAEASSTKHEPGEAAKYGVLYDDREYDYTKHLKEMGASDAVFVSRASTATSKTRELRGDINILDDTESRIARLNLPSDVFASEYEEDVGLLNRAEVYVGPQPQLDDDVREVLEALDMAEDEIPEGEEGDLDDDFIALADESGSEEEGATDDYDGSDDNWSDVANLSDLDDDEELSSRKGRGYGGMSSKFSARMTSASLTSAMIPRSEHLVNLDDRFENVLAEYDDEEIGELNDEDPNVVKGNNLKDYDDIFDEFLEEREENLATRGAAILGRIQQVASLEDEDTTDPLADVEPNMNRPHRVRFHLPAEDEETQNEEEEDEQQMQPEKERWDCESILSTYSNLDNHPGLILEHGLGGKKRQIRLGRSGIPIGAFRNLKKAPAAPAVATSAVATSTVATTSEAVAPAAPAVAPVVLPEEPKASAPVEDKEEEDGEEGEEEDEDDEERTPRGPVNLTRVKGETAEERRARKKAVKEMVRERRVEKKSTTVMFKKEKLRQEKEQIANRMSSALLL